MPSLAEMSRHIQPQSEDGLEPEMAHLFELLRAPYSSELDYFRANPSVAGMATDDNRIILNPFTDLSKDERKAVVINEAARIAIRLNTSLRPDFALSTEQTERFGGYGSVDDQAATIAARLLSGDPSAGKPTPDQLRFVERLWGAMRSRSTFMPQPPVRREPESGRPSAEEEVQIRPPLIPLSDTIRQIIDSGQHPEIQDMIREGSRALLPGLTGPLFPISGTTPFLPKTLSDTMPIHRQVETATEENPDLFYGNPVVPRPLELVTPREGDTLAEWERIWRMEQDDPTAQES